MPLKCMTIKKRTEKQWEQCFYPLLIILCGSELSLQISVVAVKGSSLFKDSPITQDQESISGPTYHFQQLHFPLACLLNLLCQPLCLNTLVKWKAVWDAICKWVQVLISTLCAWAGLWKSPDKHGATHSILLGASNPVDDLMKLNCKRSRYICLTTWQSHRWGFPLQFLNCSFCLLGIYSFIHMSLEIPGHSSK